MKQDDERDQASVQSVFQHTGEQISDSMHKAAHAASQAAESIGDGIGAARRAAKQGSYAATELYCDAKRCVQRNPVETVVASLAMGVAAGIAFSWIQKRMQHCPLSQRHPKNM